MARLASIQSLTRKPINRWHRMGHNTRFMSYDPTNWLMCYHRTDVIEYNSHLGQLIVRHNGWMSRTTAERISHGLAHLGLRLLTHDLPGVWRVADYKGNAWTIYDGRITLRRNPKTNDWERDGVNPFFTLKR